MQFHYHKQFGQALNALWKKGGPYQRAAKEIEALIGRVAGIAGADVGDPFRGMRRTKHGESRIRHCAKYDLQKFSRLVTVQTDGYCILLYCADHEDCERWIEEHRGLDFVVGESMRVAETYRSVGDAENQRVGGTSGHYSNALFERLPETVYEDLMAGVPRKVARSLEQVEASVTEAELWEIVAGIDDGDRRRAVYDVFAQLRADRFLPAIARIKEFEGELTLLDEVAPEELPDIVDSDVLRRIDPKSPQYAEALRRFMRSARYRDWMLFMHPDQDRIVDEDFDGPAKLVGVSGSGKTCVVVRRAVRLAERYPGERVLVLTLNRALAQLIDELVTACSPEGVRERIEVKPFFVLCQELMLGFDPRGARIYDEVTWKSNEHVDEVWQEYYRCETNNYDARVLQPVHDSLLARGCSAERYLREEVDWLRSALRPDDRSRYLEINRVGRKVHLPRAYREMVLEGGRGWEEKMSVVGVVDALGLAQALIEYLPLIHPRYRCVLVDEVQDFGNVELEIISALVAPGENDVFLCGDAAQAVTTKYQRLKDVGILIPAARSRRLSQNYRNSSDVLGAAYQVLMNNLSDDLLDREDLDILDPEFSAFSGTTPLLLEANDLSVELRGALALGRERIENHADAKGCIAVCGFSLFELTRYGEMLGLPVLNGTTSLDYGSLFLSDLAQTKGFEFDLVCIVNCTEGVLPDRTAPEEERYRDLAMLYVAMTRAKTDLVLSWSGAPSPLLRGAEAKLLAGSWDEYVPDLAMLTHVPVPQHLDAYRDGNHRKPWRDMTAEEFLYSESAIGVSVELSAKMRALVTGRGVKKRDLQLQWARLGQAADSFRRDARCRNLWGPEVGRQFAELVARLPASVSEASTPQASMGARLPTTRRA
jgi:hypothetical protein